MSSKEIRLYPPKRRVMNEDPNDDFVAIDFETMSPQRTSACALGMVRVIDGVIAQKFYSLINPIRDDKTEEEVNFRIHGIPLSEAEKAPVFAEIFPLVRGFIQGLKIVCHNRSVDINVLRALMEYYGLSGIDTDYNECTYALTGKSLENCCKEYGIKLLAHHDALCDAEACAKVYLNCIGKPYINQSTGPLAEVFAIQGAKQINREFRKRLEDEEIDNKTTIFYNSTVVITGTFDSFEERNDLAQKLQSLGAKITSSITKKTSIVVVGDGAGPKKLEKIADLRQSGVDIRIVYEPELIEIISLTL